MRTGCKEWRGSTSGDYGIYRGTSAHRAAWLLAGREIPDGKFVLHRCDNRRCVNVEHLFLGDHDANMTDMQRKLRGRKSASGLPPYVRSRKDGRFDAVATVRGFPEKLGPFETAQEAHQAAVSRRVSMEEHRRQIAAGEWPPKLA